METTVLSRSRFSPIAYYSIPAWTLLCFLGTWYIILEYGILRNGFVGVVVTFLFATVIWAIPFSALVLFYLYLTPSENPPAPRILFKDLIRKGMSQMEEAR